jgi:hypothetical protein
MNAMKCDSRTCTALLATLALAVGMATSAHAAGQSALANATPTASGDVQRGEFQSRAEPLRRLPPVASEGGCEPRYRNGLVGTCINHQPCRGFGVRETEGKAACICYVKRGGCDADERCDAQEGQCVKDDESEFNRDR